MDGDRPLQNSRRKVAAAKRPVLPIAAAVAARTAPRPVLIAIPFYGRPELADRVLNSVLDCADEIIALRGELLLLGDDPGNAPLAQALDGWARRMAPQFACRLEMNASNVGFVRTCNLAIDEAVRRGMDLLLLNSDVVVSPGALTEIARVSRLDPMIGFVNPRSNNATLATLPFQDRYRAAPPAEAEAAWRQVAAHLPEMSYTPTAVGFCLYVRWTILAEFGGFDEIYGSGYNEENDLVMRAGRRGYRAVLANHAFVWHEGGGSFQAAQARAAEARNRAILLQRYPEYVGLTESYFSSPEQRAERLLGALLPDEAGRVEVALDLSSFGPAHNGTTEVARHLLTQVVERWGDRYSISILCSPAAFSFHGYARYGVKWCDPQGSDIFAAIFRIGQPYDWEILERLTFKAATFGILMLDTISLDCTRLYSPRLYGMWSFAIEHSDLIHGASAEVEAQFNRRFRPPSMPRRLRSLHSMDFKDYEPCPRPGSIASDGHIFIIGNHFWHKDVAAAVEVLSRARPDRRLFVVGGSALMGGPVDEGLYAPTGLVDRPNVTILQGGEISEEDMGDLYRRAAAVVFPSHYEGFGMPIFNALAAKRPIFVRPLAPYVEIEAALGGDPNIHLFETTAALAAALETPPAWVEAGASQGVTGDAGRTADDIGAAIDTMIAHPDYDRIVRRIRAIQTLQDYANLNLGPGRVSYGGGLENKEARAAYFGALKAQALLEKLFRIRLVYDGVRCLHYLNRWLRGGRAAQAGPTG